MSGLMAAEGMVIARAFEREDVVCGGVIGRRSEGADLAASRKWNREIARGRLLAGGEQDDLATLALSRRVAMRRDDGRRTERLELLVSSAVEDEAVAEEIRLLDPTRRARLGAAARRGVATAGCPVDLVVVVVSCEGVVTGFGTDARRLDLATRGRLCAGAADARGLVDLRRATVDLVSARLGLDPMGASEEIDGVRLTGLLQDEREARWLLCAVCDFRNWRCDRMDFSEISARAQHFSRLRCLPLEPDPAGRIPDERLQGLTLHRGAAEAAALARELETRR